MFTFCYDMAKNLPSFDIVNATMAADELRRDRGEARLAIAILPGPQDGFRNGKIWPEPHTPGRQAMMHNVVIPMCRMLPSAASVVNLGYRPAELAGMPGYGDAVLADSFVRAYARGVRPLRPAAAPASDPRLVTITLRECEHWPTRNSKVAQWIAAANAIAGRGFEVVVVRDTLRADEPLPDVIADDPPIKTDPAAARDLEARAALYRSAACNLFVSNGPAWFALALDAPVVMLRPASPDAGRCATPEYLKRCGITPGKNLPGAPAHQRIVWADDTADAILAAFDDFMAGAATIGGARREAAA